MTLSLGPISTLVDLETVAPTVKSGANRICPDHVTKLSQAYKCPGTSEAEAHEVPWGTWKMGMPTDDGYRVLNTAAKPAVEAASGFQLVPVPRDQLESATFEGAGVYYAKPSNEHAWQTWGAFEALVRGTTAFVCRGAIRKGAGTEKLWRVASFNGYLVLREIRFPENLKPSPVERGIEADPATLELLEGFIEKMKVEWSEFDSEDKVAKRLEAWMSEGEEYESSDHAEPAPVLDLKAQLEALMGV